MVKESREPRLLQSLRQGQRPGLEALEALCKSLYSLGAGNVEKRDTKGTNANNGSASAALLVPRLKLTKEHAIRPMLSGRPTEVRQGSIALRVTLMAMKTRTSSKNNLNPCVACL